MMNLDEAIKHAEEIAKEQEKEAKEWHENQVRKCELFPFAEMDYTHENECAKCAEEHRQLAEWLKELKELRVRYSQLRRDCNETIDVIGKLRDELKAYKETWCKLGMWLADTRLAIAPDETLDDVDEKLVRVAQVDMIDTVLEWMDKQEVKE